MPEYIDLLKLFEDATKNQVTLVLPHPLEEIFPEKMAKVVRTSPPQSADATQRDLLKKAYEDLVNTTFRRAA